MTLDDAIASMKEKLAQGDAISGDGNWAGGGFKAIAVRRLLVEAERWKVLQRLRDTGTAENFLSVDAETKRDFFAMAVDDSERRKRAENAVKDAVAGAWIESEREDYARIRLVDFEHLQNLAGAYE